MKQSTVIFAITVCCSASRPLQHSELSNYAELKSSDFENATRLLDDDEPVDPCQVDEKTQLTEKGETEQQCKQRRMQEDMEQTTTVFLGVIFFLITIGLICCCLAYKSVYKNSISFGKTLVESCTFPCCKKKEGSKEEDDGEDQEKAQKSEQAKEESEEENG